ncbi:hypothetical protein NHP190020_12780 [Helicobacter suis]|uniref:Uncharacterized protein n=1 Tax=Helicobacter suis TaxID=104628 RepID=A0A6J4CYI2_9HELI|nr:hypothetical protein NHP190020_12780 [Helicobacter suis]BCD50915.1 hypothetical protein NHP194022_05860 [Helicobacter suis]BCD70578.1 hypothetical protein SNTW_12230 [Helicobacter suis]BDR27910.1 hypothetical protein HSHS1_06710 [Helicobacter suis HS1]GFK16249.1 hypothetical protein NHP190033_04250 [Helicobacter suis]
MGFWTNWEKKFNDLLIEYNNLLKQHEKLERELTELKAKKAESRAFFCQTKRTRERRTRKEIS